MLSFKISFLKKVEIRNYLDSEKIVAVMWTCAVCILS